MWQLRCLKVCSGLADVGGHEDESNKEVKEEGDPVDNLREKVPAADKLADGSGGLSRGLVGRPGGDHMGRHLQSEQYRRFSVFHKYSEINTCLKISCLSTVCK